MTTDETLGRDDFVAMLAAAQSVVRDEERLLDELDRAVGDGDHGSSMRRAMNLACAAADDVAAAPLADLFRSVGMAVLSVDGGATGPLFGSFFLGMAAGPDARDAVDATGVASILSAGLDQLRKRTKAEPGDKTLVDALAPAVEAAQQAAAAGEGVTGVLDRAATAAEEGAQATAAMVCRHGRGKHQGERVLGHRDPGAVSSALILRAFSDSAQQRLTNLSVDKRKGN